MDKLPVGFEISNNVIIKSSSETHSSSRSENDELSRRSSGNTLFQGTSSWSFTTLTQGGEALVQALKKIPDFSMAHIVVSIQRMWDPHSNDGHTQSPPPLFPMKKVSSYCKNINAVKPQDCVKYFFLLHF